MANEFGTAQLNLDPDSIKEIVRGSILKAIDEQAQERLIAGAIEYLMEKPANSGPYGRKDAPVVEIFKRAVYNAAQEIIFDEFKSNPSLVKAVEDVVHPMVMKMADGNYEGLPEAIGSAFAEWIRSQRSDQL